MANKGLGGVYDLLGGRKKVHGKNGNSETGSSGQAGEKLKVQNAGDDLAWGWDDNGTKTEEKTGEEKTVKEPSEGENTGAHADGPAGGKSTGTDGKGTAEGRNAGTDGKGTAEGRSTGTDRKGTTEEYTEDNDEYETDKQKMIYFQIVLDKTISMMDLYKGVYGKLESLINDLDRAVRNYRKKGQVGLKWGLTLITEDEPEQIRFRDSYFTTSAAAIKKALKSFRFEGGAPDGRENINDALEAAIRAMGEESQGEGKCGLLLLTDSLPPEDDMDRDLEFIDGTEYTGLRFAHCFVYDCNEDFNPVFNMVDGEGDIDVRGINNEEYMDLEDYLNGTSAGTSGDAITKTLVKKILHQTSTAAGL